MPKLNDRHYRKAEMKGMSIPKVLESLPDQTILQQYSALYEATTTYTRKFYTNKAMKGEGASQIMIEQASASVLLPWPQILDLLDDEKTTLGMLAMCIARTMLSRSLLLKLGTSNGTGSTFLPPEIMDCFQSFCTGRSALTLDGREPEPMNLALLSRWKQISATLLHSTYVTDAFSPFDARTMNIEHAMEDLCPLLATYAIPDNAGCEEGARISELRDLLREGARFAFTLFSQPCLWRFDWYENREIETAEGQLMPSKVRRIQDSAKRSESKRFKLPLAEIVIWPRLLRVIDETGCRLVGEGRGVVCGEAVYLEQFL